jgi:hypothetical protein
MWAAQSYRQLTNIKIAVRFGKKTEMSLSHQHYQFSLAVINSAPTSAEHVRTKTKKPKDGLNAFTAAAKAPEIKKAKAPKKL